MTSEVEIGVWVEGVQKWVTGVTRRTTCHDLIKALLRAQHSGRTDDSDVIQYVIVERWRKVERPLDHEQRILKVWRTWGEAVGEVRFSLRRVRDGETGGPDGGSSGRPERSRRRQKWKHAYGSKETLLQPKKAARDDPKFSETMERLMRLVVAQGETIQAQLRRLQEREQQIEQYEQQMHMLRVQNLGTDYLLHSYLKDEQGEAKDEPGSEEKSNDSGVVTEEVVETTLSQNVEEITAEEDAATATNLEEIQELTVLLTRMEEINNQMLHEEETLSGISTAVSAAHEQHKDEAELLHQELSCVSHIHAQLVADVRQNEQTLRETEVVLWQQRKQLELLLQEDTESDLETQSLRQHLEYIIHLPPSAFQLPAEEDDLPQKQTISVSSTTTRVPPLNNNSSTERNGPHISSTSSNIGSEVTVKDDDVPPPLPSCPPPVIEEEEEEGHLNKNSTLCVSSRSSTSSNASTSSSTSSINRKTPSSSIPKKASSSCTASSSKTNEAGGKDTDSTDSNSDTGLSSLHSSSDEGAYVLDTLV